MWADIALVLGAYILGSIPHLRFLAKLRHVELDGDFHENLWYRGSKTVAVVGVLGEFVKGVLPVLVGKGLDFGLAVVAVAGLAAVCGQMWPVFSKFDGEKGNSIGMAMVIALTPVPGLAAVIIIIIALIVRAVFRLMAKPGHSGDRSLIGGSYSRSLPLGMVLCFLSLPIIAWYLGEPVEIVWSCAVLFMLIMIRRLTVGLRDDLKVSRDIGSILLKRLLYDRAIARWRQ
ncbi:MAG TPA: glycerol-3-phosphate acyltransferase [Dehalococcoidales bacterium]|nr:glycerol-3-phosphate acyltransferase [Dehalococcoidales bacterium]